MGRTIPLTRSEQNGAPAVVQRQAQVLAEVNQIPGNGTFIYTAVKDEHGKLLATAHVWVTNLTACDPLLGSLANIMRDKVTAIVTS